MKLDKLIIKNFLSIQSAELNLSDRGLVAIEGENLDKTGSDNNGAGKSTIINAVLWCNYGDYAKSGKSDSVVNAKAKRNCMVQCVWIDDTETYRITRYRKHSKAGNSTVVELQDTEGNWKDITKAPKLIQEQIDDILGADLKTFKAANLVPQQMPTDIPALTDKQLKELLENALPFDKLDKSYTAAVKNLSELRTEILALEVEITNAKFKLDTVASEGKEAVSNFKNYVNEALKHNNEIDNKIALKEKETFSRSLRLRDEKSLLAKIHKVRKQIEEVKVEDFSWLRVQKEDLTSLIEKTRVQLKDVDFCPTCKQVVKNVEDIKKALITKVLACERELEDIERRIHEASVKRDEKYELSTSLDELFIELDEHRVADRIINDLRADISRLQAQRKDLTANPYERTVERLRDAHSAARSDYLILKEELELCRGKLPILEAVYKTYSPSGVRYHILESVTPYLTERTNYYLNHLTDGAITAIWSTVYKLASGDYREKFSIEIQMGDVKEYGLLSGGEQRKVKLACFFALQDLVASRASKSIEIFCVDEIDHALDEAGLERLMVILNDKMKLKSTILVISHNSLSDWIPNTIRVVREKNVSKVMELLNEK